MKKLFHSLFFMLLFLCSGELWADVFEHPLNDLSKNELLQSLNQISNYNVISGNFKQIKFVKRLKHNFVSTGVFRVSKTSGVVWKTQKPFYSEWGVSENEILERSASGEIRKISTEENSYFSEFSKIIQSLLLGNVAELKMKFDLYYEKKHQNAKIGLVPREASVRKFISNVVMDVSENIDKIVVENESGSVTYEFKNHKSFDEIGTASNSP